MNVTLIVADAPTASYAAVFTSNAFCGAPVTLGRRRMHEGLPLQALCINNKVSNVCAAGDGVADAETVCSAVAAALDLPGGSSSVLPSSTGVIGWKLPVDAMVKAVPDAVGDLQRDSLLPAAKGIMTTDRYPKLRSVEACGGRLVGIAKGAGMIEPNMATMLSFILTDLDVPRSELQRMLAAAADSSFNCMSVDADQSTSDTLVCISSATTPLKASRDQEALAEFEGALRQLCEELSGDVARNGEGTSHVIRVRVSGSPTREIARGVGKAVVNSPLFKTAVAGNDPNVGRLVGAVGSYLGRAAPELELGGVSMRLGGRTIFKQGSFDLDSEAEAELSAHLKQALITGEGGVSLPYPPHERCVEVEVELGNGDEAITVVGSDLTREYVDINADYRS
uniref:Arginine biosynthesis bifunctional protein ArgJ, mitochondrial n=1 Tax=Coccolithus braarudii TaxID=221442 RepID=A0A7S0LID0_9EUKA|mmetsp:Transcript_39932/g.85227  ORF Transcript_39932/g.85227 Transcript_39932/m.85227 type:complete len:395 (+) Transcript_39932:2-1186(+)